jgi:hypothetical protein
MKITLSLFLTLALLFFAYPADAQETEKSLKPGSFVMNQFKVPYQNVARFNALQDSIFAPLLDEFMEEGKLQGWGVLTHAWGDEWNYNWYYVTENHKAFLDFWGEFVGRVNMRFPGTYSEIEGLFTDHKDNFYSIRSMR